TLLSIAETNAQFLHLNLLSFNNRAGHNSLNNSPAPSPAAQTTLNPFGSLPSAFGAGLLAGSLFGRGSPYPYYPYYGGYGGYGPYTPTNYYIYYGRYPYYYYYYRG
ncbi:unnamed protein product, partial [Cercopithifilaria johnstoni]